MDHERPIKRARVGVAEDSVSSVFGSWRWWNDRATKWITAGRLLLDRVVPLHGRMGATDSHKMSAPSLSFEGDHAKQDVPVAVRLKVENAPYYASKKELMKYLQLHKVDAANAKKVSEQEFFIVRFDSEEKAQHAWHVFETHPWKKCILKPHRLRVEENRDAREPLRERRTELIGTVAPAAHADAADDVSLLCSADVVAPLRKIPYEVQCAQKSAALCKALRTTHEALKVETERMGKERRLQGGKHAVADTASILSLDAFVECPEDERMFYRNKNDLTFGYEKWTANEALTAPTLGFRIGRSENGETRVGSISDECLTASKTAIWVAQRMMTVLSQVPELPVWNQETSRGFWRSILVREGFRTRQCVVSLQICNAEVSPDMETRAKKIVHEALMPATDGCPHADIIGICYQVNKEMNNTAALSMAHTVDVGVEHFVEQICGLQFRIGMSSFFQVHTGMAERLYQFLGEWASLNEQTVLLDICCGTGTIALSQAAAVHHVIGIEMVASAVADAIHNAEQNGIKNATFLVGKAEDMIRSAVKLAGDKDCVAIVDPPRAGLGSSVGRAIRLNPQIRKVIYVCCDSGRLAENMVPFCKPASKKFSGMPFRLTAARGFDLFPYTDHSELVVLLER
ncbi:tRNA (uracil-5-)-methyltransferase-like A [Porphyridium purpureum]|uniref:tRNA (Uracil-5-)-methyltransferase-like A n=1 Tax=Porphyridium purpureum TaxID=35688 RepID=A0A5J4YV24_PORPP|nr:tRNA (uracil-5-)-methyltransferase-like A [Porphyridium purpureum]|eukprot:POR5854..scf209_3